MFEPAGTAEVPALLALRDSIAGWMVDRGIKQWLPGEFPLSRMQSWVERGDVFVHRSELDIVAVVAVLDEDPDFWGHDEAEAGYIHLLMVDRAHAGEGLGDAALVFAEQEILRRGGDVARLDVVATNSALLGWYVRRGYRPVGTKTFDAPHVPDCRLFEKSLDTGSDERGESA